MAATTLDLSGVARLKARVERLAGADFGPLMQDWEKIIAAGHAEGLVAGTDRHGKAMPTTVRESDPKLSARLGSGRPLVPKDLRSRAIRAAQPFRGQSGARWFAGLLIRGFEAKGGRSVLAIHAARGRDVLGVRPATAAKCREALKRYMGELARKRG